MQLTYTYDDGGRSAAGYTGRAGDCVCRAIAIATGRPYQEVYDALNRLGKSERTGKRSGRSSSRNGVYKQAYHSYLLAMGWRWTPTMGIGTGCRVHLADGELPSGRLVVVVSKHLVAVVDGVIRDTSDPRRTRVVCEGGVQRTAQRCAYGYFAPGEQP